MKAIRTLAAVAICACIAFPLHALADEYELVLTIKMANGETTDAPSFYGFFRGEYFDCLHAKKKVEIGRKFPKGLFVSPDGSTPPFTITGARCVQLIPKMGQ